MSRDANGGAIWAWLVVMLPTLVGCSTLTGAQSIGEGHDTPPTSPLSTAVTALPNATRTTPPSRTPSSTPDVEPQRTPTAFQGLSVVAGTYVVYSISERPGASGAIRDAYYAIPAEGGPPKPLLTLPLGSSSSLSPDGKTLAYTMSRVNLGGRPELMLLDMGTGGTTKVPDSLDCGAPSWSPDGKELALVCGRDTKNIYVMRLPDYGRVSLTTWQEEYENQLSPEWSPDGKWLAFLNYIGGQRTDPREGIYLLDTDCLADPGGCQQPTHGPLDCVEWFVWSSDSTAVGCVEGSNIRFIDISTRQSWDMRFPRSIAGFAWSPSGEQLAVSLAESSIGLYTDVFVRDSGDEALTQITQGQGDKYVRFWLVVP